MWSLAVNGGAEAHPSAAGLEKLARGGITTIVTRGHSWTPAGFRHLLALARQLKLTVVEPVSPPRTARARTRLRRSCASRHHVVDRCAVVVKTNKGALRLARASRLDFVIRYLDDPRPFGQLFPNRSSRTRIIGVIRLRSTATMDAAWQQAVRLAWMHPATSLGVGPMASRTGSDLESYLGLIKSGGRAPTETPPPVGGVATAAVVVSSSAGGSSGSGGSSGGGGGGGSSGGGGGSSGGGGGSSGGGSSDAPPSVFVSPSGNDSTCVRGDASKPCLTFDRAYHIAEQGDFVQVAAGNYGSEGITYDPSKTSGICDASDVSGCVTFEPAPGASVQIGEVTTLNTGGTTISYTAGRSYTLAAASTTSFATTRPYSIDVGPNSWNCTGGADANHFYGCVAPAVCNGGTGGTCNWSDNAQIFQGGLHVGGAAYVRLMGFTVKGGMTVDAGTSPYHTPHDIVFQNESFQGFGGAFNSNSPAAPYNLAFIGGTYGDTNISKAALTFSGANAPVVRDVTIQNVTKGACVGNGLCHYAGVYLNGNTDATFDRDLFAGNQLYDIFNSYGSNSSGDSNYNPGLTVTNSMFEQDGIQAAIYFRVNNSDTFDGVTLQGNSFGDPIEIDNGSASGASLTNWTVAGNIFASGGCLTQEPGFTNWGVTEVYNVMASPSCSSTSSPVANHNVTGVAASSIWADDATPPLDLISTATPAEGIVPAVYCNAEDYYGNARPTPCDAGADQR